MRTWCLAVLAGMTFASAGSAQTAGWRFQWQTGQVIEYRVEQTTSAAEILQGKKTETTQKLTLVKRWQVLGIDASGVATVQKSLTALRVEQTSPGGEIMLYDSANADKSNPQMREQLAAFVGVPLAVLRIDAKGRVVEVKECKHGKPSQYDSELPFTVALPDVVPQAGQTWDRNYQVTLEPPEGTGDKYEATQKYTCKSVQGSLATVSMTTVFKALPQELADQMPLLHLQPEGEVVFDTQSGRLRSARTTVNKELKNHQGEDSSYRFQSSYSEQLIGAN